jgi:hypothetical protein
MVDLEQYMGRVQRIFENETNSGKKYRVFEVLENGETIRYSVWNDLGIDIQEGDQIQYSWKQSGNYKNLATLNRIQQEGQAQEQSHHTRPAYNDRDKMISKSVSLKAAVRFLAYIPEETSLEDRLRQVMDISGKFEQYLLGNEQENNGYSETNDVPF